MSKKWASLRLTRAGASGCEASRGLDVRVVANTCKADADGWGQRSRVGRWTGKSERKQTTLLRTAQTKTEMGLSLITDWQPFPL